MEQIWAAMKADTDMWEDAKMMDVCVYLRGARGLCVPEGLRKVLGMNG